MDSPTRSTWWRWRVKQAKRTARPTLCPRLELLEDRVLPSGVAQLLRDVNLATRDSAPQAIIQVGPVVYLLADDGVHGYELWRTDGTAAGTALVKDLNPGAGHALRPEYSPRLTNLNGTLFFVATDGTAGYELWKSDGTEAGTVLVKDINPGPGSSLPNLLTVVGDLLFFDANNGVAGIEPWRSDGTAAGTQLVK